jgi:hypothetical protein
VDVNGDGDSDVNVVGNVNGDGDVNVVGDVVAEQLVDLCR